MSILLKTAEELRQIQKEYTRLRQNVLMERARGACAEMIASCEHSIKTGGSGNLEYAYPNKEPELVQAIQNLLKNLGFHVNYNTDSQSIRFGVKE